MASEGLGFTGLGRTQRLLSGLKKHHRKCPIFCTILGLPFCEADFVNNENIRFRRERHTGLSIDHGFGQKLIVQLLLIVGAYSSVATGQ